MDTLFYDCREEEKFAEASPLILQIEHRHTSPDCRVTLAPVATPEPEKKSEALAPLPLEYTDLPMYLARRGPISSGPSIACTAAP